MPTEKQVMEKVRKVTGARGLGFNDIFGRAYYTDLLKKAGWRWGRCQNEECASGHLLTDSDIELICPSCSGKGGEWVQC